MSAPRRSGRSGDRVAPGETGADPVQEVTGEPTEDREDEPRKDRPVRWRVVEGGLFGDAVDHAAVEQALRESGAVALARPEGPDALGAVLAVTGRAHRVAIVQDGVVAPGPPLFRFVDDLAAATGTEVNIADVWAGGEVYVGDVDEFADVDSDESDGAATAGDAAVGAVATREAPVRVAAVTAMPLREVPFWTEDLGVAVAVLDRGDRRLVLTDRGGLGVGGWGRHALPVVELVVRSGEPTVEVTLEGGRSRMWTWSTGWSPVGAVPPEDDAASRAFAEDVLGAGGMAAEIHEALPEVEVGPVREALAAEPADGISRLVSALGLPPDADDVLAGRLPALAVPGARVYEPRGIAHALGETVALETRGYGAIPGFWRLYRGVAVDRPAVMRAAVGTEALLGAATLAAAVRSGRRGSRAGAVLGGWMLLDAAAELAAARWVARHTTPEGRFVPPEHLRRHTDEQD